MDRSASSHRVVSRQQWLAARKAHLVKEKEFTRLRDQLSHEARQLPWVKLDKSYVFDSQTGSATLADLFDGRSQLLVYHFMFAPEWSQGCKSCSLLADHFDPLVIHMNHRDVSMAVVSRAPIDKLQAFRQRMGWSFDWVSSFRNDFNQDFGVSFTDEQTRSGLPIYNYDGTPFPFKEAPGLSVFHRDAAGDIYHTYSTYSRGLDIYLGVYNFLDITPKGRDEEHAPGMAWVRHHDRYDDVNFIDPWAEPAAAAATA